MEIGIKPSASLNGRCQKKVARLVSTSNVRGVVLAPKPTIELNAVFPTYEGMDFLMHLDSVAYEQRINALLAEGKGDIFWITEINFTYGIRRDLAGTHLEARLEAVVSWDKEEDQKQSVNLFIGEGYKLPRKWFRPARRDPDVLPMIADICLELFLDIMLESNMSK